METGLSPLRNPSTEPRGDGFRCQIGQVLAIEAAIAGRGVALGVNCLVAHDIAVGRSVGPFSGGVPAKCAYHFVCASDAMGRFAVRAFHDWLLEEATRDQLAAG
jgi:DNA-binding transcriptional LysR family regulator